MRFIGGFVFAFLAAGAAGGFLAWRGHIDVAAKKPSLIERNLLEFVVDRSVARRAPRTDNPRGDSPAVLAEGLDHYRANCLICHGAPGIEPSDIGKGLSPPAPDLSVSETQSRSDGQLFWIASQGIRMTGMPAFGGTHSKDEIWSLVSFIRHLADLTPGEKDRLRMVVGGHEHRHERAAAGAVPMEPPP